ncbi:MAG: penicillin-binding protein 2 [Candidatus Pelagibacter sp.]|nr:penicillin-binding protein 2 [Candidatus Pelagibacter sp.]|tara:strand:- start:2955 stop:4886 length:1932 start_codon:yes stop_codon:yes gene_type:complete
MINFGSGNTVIKSKLISRRMFVLTAAKTIVFCGIFGRLVSLQINEATKYKTLSDKNRFREWKLAPQRGLIRDYFDKEIASNEKVYQLHITPENSPNLETLFFRLKTILNLSEKRIFYLKRKIAKQKPWEPIIVSDNLTWSEFSRINLFLHELPGVEPIVSVARQYPDQSAAHLVGYVSQVSQKDLQKKQYLKDMSVGIAVGKTGLENKLDKDIIGKVGFQRYEVNAFGKRIKQIQVDPGESGKNYRTTIDLEVQKYTSKVLEDKAASVCVMDIYNGDIITLASSPSYDPNSFVHGIDKKYWNELISNEKKPLNNKAIAGLYPPGSTIKIIVALSAMENGVWNPKKYVNCNGVTELYGEKFHCWKKKGHGPMNMRSAIQRSCDVYFYEVARILGVDRLSETAKKFGLGKKVLDGFIEEREGVVPSTAWKRKFIGKNWYLGETLHSGIGQGYFQSTPLQLCLMTAQIANGGFEIKPRVLVNEKKNNLREYIKYKNENPNEPLPIDMLVSNFDLNPLFRNQENINFIKDAMFAATNEAGGTSFRSRYNDQKFMFAGKTGSSQVKRFTALQRELEIKQKDIEYKDRDHALFVAFAPYSDPKYAISVVVEHGGTGSGSAAPIAKKIIKKVLERDKLRQNVENLIGEEI